MSNAEQTMYANLLRDPKLAERVFDHIATDMLTSTCVLLGAAYLRNDTEAMKAIIGKLIDDGVKAEVEADQDESELAAEAHAAAEAHFVRVGAYA